MTHTLGSNSNNIQATHSEGSAKGDFWVISAESAAPIDIASEKSRKKIERWAIWAKTYSIGAADMTQKPTNHAHCKYAAIAIQYLSSPSSLCDIGLRPLYMYYIKNASHSILESSECMAWILFETYVSKSHFRKPLMP